MQDTVIVFEPKTIREYDLNTMGIQYVSILDEYVLDFLIVRTSKEAATLLMLRYDEYILGVCSPAHYNQIKGESFMVSIRARHLLGGKDLEQKC